MNKKDKMILMLPFKEENKWGKLSNKNVVIVIVKNENIQENWFNMIINNTFKFIFIHIPRAAGTTITNLLSKLTTYCDLEIGGTHFGETIQSLYRKRFGLSKHSPSIEVIKVIGMKEWIRFFTFTFVRNPFTRIYSIYNFSKRWANLPEKYKKIMDQFNSFEEFVLSGILEKDPGYDNIFRPQTYWITDPHNKKILVDFVGKVENLKDDLMYVLEVIEAKKLIPNLDNLPILNQSEPFDIKAYENPTVIDVIRKIYSIDFDLFQYPNDVEIFFK